MKHKKYAGIILGVVAALAVALWVLRNSIIEEISNPLLARYGLTVTGVSLDALATRNATISYLELTHQSGAELTIENLTLPIQAGPDGFRRYAATQLNIEWPEGDGAESPTAAVALQQLLALPMLVPDTVVDIASISIQSYPAIRDLHWELSAGNQQLAMQVGAVPVHTAVMRHGDERHAVNLVFSDIGGPAGEQSVTIDIQRAGTEYVVAGAAQIDLPFWAQAAGALAILPFEIGAGTAELQFDTVLRDASDDALVVYASLLPTSPVTMSVPDARHPQASVVLLAADPFEFSLAVQEFAWELRQASATLEITLDGLSPLRALLTNQDCDQSLVCSGDLHLTVDKAALSDLSLDSMTLLASQELTFTPDEIGIRVLPNASLNVVNVAAGEISVGRLRAELANGGGITLNEGGWRFRADTVNLRLSDLVAGEDTSFSGPLALDKVELADTDGAIAATLGLFAAASEVRIGEQTLRVPGFSGGLSRRGDEIAILLTTSGLQTDGDIEIAHNLEKRTGQLRLQGAAISFASRPLSGWLRPWDEDWDIAAGSVAATVDAGWLWLDDRWQANAAGKLQFSGIAGAYRDSAFVGLATALDLRYGADGLLSVEPADLSVTLLDVGLPVRNISARYRLLPAQEAIEVEDLAMQVLGGRITADPFSFRTGAARNTLVLKAEAIDLRSIVGLQEFESIEVSGRIGAVLPVTIENDTITISGGALTGEEPGGVIRYLPGRATDRSDASGIAVATRALSNFEYDSLSSVVDYTPEGDLKLQMRLSGSNPDLEDNRPVILNLGVENNVPQMLRSLQAARAVEDIIERRLAPR